MDKIIVLDFGSQYSHLICRRIRDFSVYAELLPFDTSLDEINKLNPKGIIFSGGPSSVYDSGAPVPDEKIFQLQVPILGICYGHQIIVNNFEFNEFKSLSSYFLDEVAVIWDFKYLKINKNKFGILKK